MAATGNEYTMAKSKIQYDREENSLSVWFDDPKMERIYEEADDELILIKDKRGNIIGFERLNYLSAKQLAK
jgi:uncharacterized protein YuzE